MVRNVFPNDKFENNMFHSRIGTRNNTVLNGQIWEQCVQFTDRNSEQNSPNLPIWEQCVPFTDRNSEQNSPNLPIWEQYVPFTDGNSEQNGAKCPNVEQTVPFGDGNSEQNGAKFIHLGTKSFIHLQIGIRNKTILNNQFGNSVIHLQSRNEGQNSPRLSIWEQCVPFTDGNSEQNSPK